VIETCLLLGPGDEADIIVSVTDSEEAGDVIPRHPADRPFG
jgi:hypothetical protein